MLETLSERITYYRKTSKLTQEELAEKCSVTPQAVSKWENGISTPDIMLLPRLAEIFSVTTDELLGVKREVPVAVDTDVVDVSKAILRMHVDSCGDTVDIRLPISVAKIVLQSDHKFKMGKKDALQDIDFDQIFALVSVGTFGKILEITSAEGDHVEIWVE